MAEYFSSISTILGGPGGPLAMRGTDGFSSLFSSSETESPRTSLLDRRCNDRKRNPLLKRTNKNKKMFWFHFRHYDTTYKDFSYNDFSYNTNKCDIK